MDRFLTCSIVQDVLLMIQLIYFIFHEEGLVPKNRGVFLFAVVFFTYCISNAYCQTEQDNVQDYSGASPGSLSTVNSVPQSQGQTEEINEKNSFDQGDADAQVQLGVLYYYGREVPQDDAKAVECFRKSA
ncbi:MAG: SEL1-like repeat protein, partial [Alphaproteobacteria bacterium]|nr:SEL1-like repeat protein [Alphaproteobacteria bacterium]